MEYIIVQAGGKGTRLEYLTENKPKALVPVDNLPMLFHLFRQYPDKRFVIIADYKKEVLRKYLVAFADVKYQVVDAEGTGTCSGVGQALELIPADEPFMLVLGSKNYKIDEAFILNRTNTSVEGGKVYVPIYMTMFIERTKMDMIIKPNLDGLLDGNS